MNETKQPDPMEDLKQGLALLLRAAKNAVQHLPSEKFGEAIVNSAREVSRAIENVAQTLEGQVFGRGGSAPRAEAPAAEPSEDRAPEGSPPPEAPKANGERPPRG